MDNIIAHYSSKEISVGNYLGPLKEFSHPEERYPSLDSFILALDLENKLDFSTVPQLAQSQRLEQKYGQILNPRSYSKVKKRRIANKHKTDTKIIIYPLVCIHALGA